MDANTHYTNEYHDDAVRRANILENKIKEAEAIVDHGEILGSINRIEFDPMTAKSICIALKDKDLSEAGRLFRAAAIEHVVETLYRRDCNAIVFK